MITNTVKYYMINLLAVMISGAATVSLQAQGDPAESVSGRLCIASCQFPVSADISVNAYWIEKQMIEARLKGADIVHFPECALSGYPGVDMENMDDFEWETLFQYTDSVLSLTRKFKLWVVLGSVHFLGDDVKPHNSLYLIDPEGNIIDRYDKRFCTRGDLDHFSPGDHFVSFTCKGVKCGLLICYDVRFPELCRLRHVRPLIISLCH